MSISYFNTNTIYCGDCKDVLAKFPNECADLIYADPPFFSNQQYEIIWRDGYELRAFEDRWKGGILNYVEWMKERLEQCYRVLKSDGAMYLHCDWHASHYLKVRMDDIFGRENFRNEISVKRIRKNVREFETVKRLNVAFDSILFYAKSDEHRINPPMKEEHKPARWHAFDANGLRTGMDYELFGHKPPEGGHWRWTKERAEKAIKDGKLRPNPKTGRPEYLIPASTHTILTSVWDDISAYSFKSGYPTEKSEALLERIIEMSSEALDIVLDPFCGCGTAIVVAHKKGRRWVGVDVSPTACDLMERRMRSLGVSPNMMGMPLSEEDLRKIAPFDFQNWVVKRLFGRVSTRKTSDMGIDGYTFEGVPIQVKQSDDIGRNVIDNFETAIRRKKATKGIIVAFSFGKGANEEIARAKLYDGIDIKTITIKELIESRNRNSQARL
jgi:DNA modification methylase